MNGPIEILLVEDNINDAMLTIRALKKNNLANNLVHLKDGEEALEFIFGKGKFSQRNINNLPKVILLDVKMPKVTGLEVLAVLRQNDITKKIPVVMLTSSNEDPDVEESYRLGASSYIVKPVGFDDFHKAVTDLGYYWLLLNRPPESLK